MAPTARPAWIGRVLDACLTTDPHQRIRLTMTSLATAAMLPCLVLFNALAWAGLARTDLMAWWTFSCLTGMLGVGLFIRCGWALRLRDPSLTQFQLRYALICTAGLYVLAGAARPLIPAILAIIMTFGIFGMSSRQTARTAAFGALLFSGACWLALATDPPGRTSPAMEAGSAVMVIVVLLSTTVLSLRMQRMRVRLSQQKSALGEALAQIRHLAGHDELTGLPNRRRMAEILDYELRRSRQDRPLHLAMLDLDHFKAVHDTHGHAHGDEVLRAFAAAAQASVREGDVLARWGGEEFLLLLCESDPAHAREVAERVRRAIEALPPLAPATQGVTVSIGLAMRHGSEPIERTLERADQALYDAKAQGRNRVVEAPGDA